MASSKTKSAKRFSPSGLISGLTRIFAPEREAIRFTGDFKSWEEAEEQSAGYDAPEILQKTRTALLRVKGGDAAFERDSMTFDTMQYEFPLLAGLLRVAAANRGHLDVLDFGGSLGSTYFQCRKFLSVVEVLRWSVVDQPAQVACGKADFASDELKFYETIPDCLREQRPNVLLLSSVLQYLHAPYAFLQSVLKESIPYVIIERTAFNCSGVDRLTVQHVPARLYNGSYPAWFLSEASLRKAFADDYDLVCEYEANEFLHPENGKAVFKGFQFHRKSDQGFA